MPSINGIVSKIPPRTSRKANNIGHLHESESVIRWKLTCKHNSEEDTGVGE